MAHSTPPDSPVFSQYTDAVHITAPLPPAPLTHVRDFSSRGRAASDPVTLHDGDTEDTDEDYDLDSSGSGYLQRSECGSVRRYRPLSASGPRPSSYHSRRHYSRRSQQRPRSFSSVTTSSELRSPSGSPTGSPSPQTHQMTHAYSEDNAGFYVNEAGNGSPLVLEENLRRLKEINDGIARLREINQEHLTSQDARKESLQRYSTSCPSLAQEMLVPPVTPATGADDTGHFKSLLDLTGANSSDHLASRSDEGGGGFTPPPRPVEPTISICINDVTVDSTDDFSTQDSDTGGDSSIGHVKKTRRRSSWCPEEGRKQEEKREKQRMLSVTGRSQSLSSLDGQDDSDDEDDDDSSDDGDYSEHHSSAQSSSPPSHGHMYQPGDDMYQPEGDHAYASFQASGGGVGSGGGSSWAHSGHHGHGQSLTPPAKRKEYESSTSAVSANSGRSLSDVGLDTTSPIIQVSSEVVGMPPCSAGRDASSPSGSGPSLVVPGGLNLMKSVSSPAIPSIHDDNSQTGNQHQGDSSKAMPEARVSAGAPFPDVEGGIEKAYISLHSAKQRPSDGMIHDQADNYGEPKSPVKEEKKRKASVFSKFGSYRQKKLVKENRWKTTHVFMSFSFKNTVTCDICDRSLAQKQALKCENCSVKVHAHSCPDHIHPCPKFKHNKVPSNDANRDKMAKFQSSSLPGANNSLKSTASMKERSRAASVPSRSLQGSHSSSTLPPRNTSPSGKVLNEEKEKDREREMDTLHAPSAMDGTNIADTLSVSMESLEDGMDLRIHERDPDLMPQEPEAEAWSVTVDKKTLKKMNNKDIKRQDHIWELIQTEKSHCRTLKIMQKVFSAGMLSEVNVSQENVNRIFPNLPELVDLHTTFINGLTELQSRKPDRSIDFIAPLLIHQFGGELGLRMKNAYGEFCSSHTEAVQVYKDLLKSDRKFEAFIKKCSRNNVCKRLSIPECILLVTQRITKYPLLIEPIIKTTKDPRGEHESLTRALQLTREILVHVDLQVDAKAKELRLLEIFHNLDARSSATYKKVKLKKSLLLGNNRKLLHEGTIKWMSARGKAFEVLAVILSDFMIFLSESNQKYTFFSQDDKSGIISLSKLLVREKGDTRDSKGLYLICQSKDAAEMYELVCRTAEERKTWIAIIRNAIVNCPDEEENTAVHSEQERKLLEARSAKLRQLIEDLHHQDQEVFHSCETKMKTILDMLEVFGHEDIPVNLRSVYRDREGLEFPDLEELIQMTLKEASSLTLLLQGTNISISRSVSSAGEHESSSYVTPPLPKRAETFAGFEAKAKDITVKQRYSSGTPDDRASPEITASSQNTSPGPLRERNGNESLLNVESVTSGRRRSSIGLPGSETNTKSNKMSSVEHWAMLQILLLGEDRVSRRMSTSFLQHLLKQGGDRDETESRTDSHGSSDRGSVGDLSSASSGVTMLNLATPPRDQCASLAQLMQYIHAIVCVSSQQCTESESVKAKLEEAHAKISCLNAECEQRGDVKRTTYQHDKQLEELRNLQESFNQERQDWYKVREHEQNILSQRLDELEQDTKQKEDEMRQRQEAWQKQCAVQRAELEAMRQELQQKQEKEKAELQRQRDALQTQIDMFERQKAAAQHSPSGLDSPKLQRMAKPGSPSQMKPVPPGSVPQTVWDTVVHKRSASDELYRGSLGDEGFTPIPTEYSNSLKEPLNMTQLRKSPVAPASGAPRDPAVPPHLLSATNEQKRGMVTAQRLPFKLAAGNHSSRSFSSSSLTQKLPFKLSGSSQPQPHPTQTSLSSPPSGRASKPQKWGDNRSAAPAVAQRMSHPQPRLSGSQSQPHLGLRHGSASEATHSILPMKLAQKQPKTPSPLAPATPHHDQNRARHSQRTGQDEPEVMYF